MSGISTHVLDVSRGRPAVGVGASLARGAADGAWSEIGRGRTDDDGRIGALLPPGTPLEAGTYRLVFALDPWFAAQGTEGFYPEAVVVFRVRDAAQHHHVPLLLSPFGYSTYRGS